MPDSIANARSPAASRSHSLIAVGDAVVAGTHLIVDTVSLSHW